MAHNLNGRGAAVRSDSLKDEMGLYDSLPPKARKAVANNPFMYSMKDMVAYLESLGLPRKVWYTVILQRTREDLEQEHAAKRRAGYRGPIDLTPIRAMGGQVTQEKTY